MRKGWLVSGFMLVASTGGLVAACGTNDDSSTFADLPTTGQVDAMAGTENDMPSFVHDGGIGFSGDTGYSSNCTPKTCAQLGAPCGAQGDGCGGIVACGTCTAPQSCGGGGVADQCGGSTVCVPKTCQALGATCGAQGDGCGGLIASCGACASPEICGGGGVPNACGGNGADGGACVPTKSACAPGECGPISDGCGGVLQCGGCTGTQICGGGGTASTCGGVSSCVPKPCAQLGAANCGPMGDGCGGLIASCGTCSGNQTCGGGGAASHCGGGATADAGPCTGLCTQQTTCSNGKLTTLTGTVFAPNGLEPLPNAIVYVPNGGAAPSYGVQPFSAKVACNQCGADITGSPLVKAFTGADGKFTLTNVPVGANIPLVIQVGRWRRMVTVPKITACTTAAVNAALTHLPRNKSEGDIPLTAIATGGVDTLECVLRKIGIEDAEFTAPSGTGRVHMYQGDTGPSGLGERPAAGNGVPWSSLWGSASTLSSYDALIFACNGDPGQASMTDADRTRILDYLNVGGRLLATHYQYVWLSNFAPFSQTATWNVDQKHPADPNTVLGDIDTSFPRGQVFAQWLGIVTALASVSKPGAPKIVMNISRHDLDPLPKPLGTGVTAPAQRWISVDPKLPPNANQSFPDGYPNTVGAPQHYTFNTPWGAAPKDQCGRVLFSDFHVSNASVDNARFPSQCDDNPLTPQEKVIEFMLFDLASCIAPDQPACTKTTCAAQGIGCGPAGDGCGGVIASCGSCNGNQTCGGGGVSGKCGGPTCTPKTCPQLGYTCGQAGDGCGGLLSCGTCGAGQHCGGGGAANTCGTPSCTPKTCAQLGVGCGPAGDGCGNIITCDTCAAPDTCGGAGVAGQCGHGTCAPRTCADANATCGPVSDGCGAILDCGTCSPPQSCGGGGVASACGGGIN